MEQHSKKYKKLKKKLEDRNFQLNMQRFMRLPEDSCNISPKHLDMIIECTCKSKEQDLKYGAKNRKFVKVGNDSVFIKYKCTICGGYMFEIPKLYYKTTKQPDGTILHK